MVKTSIEKSHPKVVFFDCFIYFPLCSLWKASIALNCSSSFSFACCLPRYLAVNEWGGKDLARRENSMAGLAYYVVEVENKEELLKVFAQSQTNKAITKWFSSAEFSVTDKDGIVTRVRVEN